MAAEEQNDTVKGHLLIFPLSDNQNSTPPFSVEVRGDKGEISFWMCNCGCNCRVVMPPTKSNCTRCGCPKRLPREKGSWICDCGCGCGSSMPPSTTRCSSCSCKRRFTEPVPEGSWRCNCGCSCGKVMKKGQKTCSACGCFRFCEQCRNQLKKTKNGECRNCLKKGPDSFPPSLLYTLQEDGVMRLVKEDEALGSSSKGEALRELNERVKKAREEVEEVEGRMAEAQSCSTGQNYELIGKLFVEKQKVEAEFKSLSSVKEITYDRRLDGCTFDLAPGIATFIGAGAMDACLTWCPFSGKEKERTLVSTTSPVFLEDGEFKCKQ